MNLLYGIPFEFFLFALTLLGVAVFHNHTLAVALAGMAGVAAYKWLFTTFSFPAWFAHEWVILANLLGLLLGFAMLADHFEKSEIPAKLPDFLPDTWWGAFALLGIVFVMSAFLDNIAAAMIGGTMAAVLFKRKVHIGYLAAIVAASNGGGSGSVLGDTTTTMMWIAGVKPGQVLDAYIGAVPAFLIFGFIAARQQHAFQPIEKNSASNVRIDWTRLGIVVFILAIAVAANIYCNLRHPQLLNLWPVIGFAVVLAVLVCAPVRAPNWALLPSALKGTAFLLSLVVCASMMPVDKLPPATWASTLGLGFLSAVFDNIPLTALALRQGGYDWGFLAYAVGFGGSMLWFGSSAGVALSNMYPEARSVGAWLKGGWHVALAYVVGYCVLMAVAGWRPDAAPSRGATKTASLSFESAP